MIVNVQEKFFEYLKKKIPNFKKTTKSGAYLFTCPRANDKTYHVWADESPSATLIQGSDKMECFMCHWKGTLYDAARIVEPDKINYTDEQITQYLMETLDIDMYRELDAYIKYGWALTPVLKNSNKAFEEDWRNTNHKDKLKWIKWLNNGFNIGLNNNNSGVIEVDVDTGEVKEELLPARTEFIKMLEDSKTLMQNTPSGGRHYFYLDDPDISQGANFGGLEIDTRTNQGMVVLSPSKRDNKPYSWVNLGAEIKPLPLEIKSKLLELKKEDSGRCKTQSIINPDDIPAQEGNLPALKHNNLEGCCNDTFVRLGGIFVTKFTPEQTEFILHVMNKNLLAQPMEAKAIKAMMSSLGGYKVTDEQTQEQKILAYLELMEKIRTDDAVKSLNLPRSAVDKYLSKFTKEGKIIRLERGTYQIKKTIKWSDECPETIEDYKYNIPYFSDVATFADGDVVLLGGIKNAGKTTIAVNMLKEMIFQGIKPYYIYSEAGSRFQKISIALGIQNKYWYTPSVNPMEIALKENAFTIIDWLDFGKLGFETTSNVLEYLASEMQKKKGILIIFTQLKPESYEWFAPNLIEQYPTFAAKYISDNPPQNTEGHWLATKIKEPKGDWTEAFIPCTFNRETKIHKPKEMI